MRLGEEMLMEVSSMMRLPPHSGSSLLKVALNPAALDMLQVESQYTKFAKIFIDTAAHKEDS
jgi:hypothetical protein